MGLIIRIVIWCALGYFGGWIAARKGYPPRLGVVAGLIFGPIALVVFALLPMTKAGREQAEIERQIYQEAVDLSRLKQCPRCGLEVSFTCHVCPRCEHHFASNVAD